MDFPRNRKAIHGSEGLRVLGIVGLDYCGSTVISNVLSGLPGTVNVGESHWILDRGIGCTECAKKPCPIFTPLLLSKLKGAVLEEENWWGIISQETGAELIVSSDKLPKHYERFGVPDYLMFVHKDPRANIYSWCRRKFLSKDDSDAILTSEQIDSGISWWLSVTGTIVDWLENQDSDISVVNLEAFAENPREMIRGISSWVAMEYDPSTIEYWTRELHYIGGNHSVKRMDQNRYFYNRISIDERWKIHISESDAKRIANNGEISMLLERANRCSQL